MNEETKNSKFEENRRSKIRLQKEKDLKIRMKERQIGKLKILIFLIFFIIPVFYQIAYLDTMKDFTFSYKPDNLPFDIDDFSYNMEIFSSKSTIKENENDISDYIDEVNNFFTYIMEQIFDPNITLNISEAYENTLGNSTLIDPLEEIIGYTIKTINDFKIALENNTVPRHITDPIYEAIYRWELPKIFPNSWNNYVYFIIGYNGDFPITDITAKIELIHEAPILMVENRENELSYEKELILSVKISTILQGILQSAYRALINATYDSMVAGGLHFYEYIGEYFNSNFMEIGLFISLSFQAKLGFIPIKFETKVDLVWIIKLLIEVYQNE